jgi:hypothetical protein
MGNRAIRDHEQNDTELHLFESTDEAWQVTYLGKYKCIDWFEEQLPDRNDNKRRGIQFKLEPVENEVAVESPDLDRMSTEDLYERAASASSGSNGESGGSTTTISTRTTYPRSEVVKEYALRASVVSATAAKKRRLSTARTGSHTWKFITFTVGLTVARIIQIMLSRFVQTATDEYTMARTVRNSIKI